MQQPGGVFVVPDPGEPYMDALSDSCSGAGVVIDFTVELTHDHLHLRVLKEFLLIFIKHGTNVKNSYGFH